MGSMFCTVADVKTFANVEGTFTGDDAKIKNCIKLATSLVRAYTRRDWEYRTHTDLFGTVDIDRSLGVGNGLLRLYLKERFIDANVPIGIAYSEGGLFDLPSSIIASDQYAFDAENGYVSFYSTLMQNSAYSVRVVYSAGFKPSSADPEILDAHPSIAMPTAQQAAFMFRRMLDQESGKGNKSNSKGSASFNIKSSGLIGEVQSQLKGYVRLLVGR